jgi:hypothetical protein
MAKLACPSLLPFRISFEHFSQNTQQQTAMRTTSRLSESTVAGTMYNIVCRSKYSHRSDTPLRELLAQTLANVWGNDLDS